MSRAYISQALRAETSSYFQGRCAYCRSPQALMNVPFEADHIVPEKVGGLTTSTNLALACPLCNGHKGAQTHAFDAQTGRRVSLFHPRFQNWFRHFRWSEDRITIEGRTASGRATINALQLNNVNLLRLRTIWLVIGSFPPNWPAPDLTDF